MKFWQCIFLANRRYKFKSEILVSKLTTKTKLFRKVVKKTKTFRLAKTIKINFNFINVLNSVPPLSTVLNLLGVNLQQFLEYYNKIYSNFYFINVPIIFTIYIMIDLSVKFFLNVNYNYLVKNVFTTFFGYYKNNNFLSYYKNINKVNFINKFVENEIFLLRYYTNQDLYFLTYLIWLNKLFILNFYTEKNFDNLLKFNVNGLNYESLIFNLLGTIKSLNIKLNKFEINN